MVTAHARSGFPWMRANIFLLAAIGSLFLYDVRRHGSLRDSSTGHFLHDLGALPYVEKGWISTQSYAHQSFRWLQKHGPEYYRQACEVSQPYLLKAKEIVITGGSHIMGGCQTAYAYGQEKVPLVLEWIEQWAPGLRDRSAEFGHTVWEQCKVFSVNGGRAILGLGQDAVMWAQTNVFIGSWSPDNLQLYSIAVLNATQQYALGTYDWLYEKVQTFSRVE